MKGLGAEFTVRLLSTNQFISFRYRHTFCTTVMPLALCRFGQLATEQPPGGAGLHLFTNTDFPSRVQQYQEVCQVPKGRRR